MIDHFLHIHHFLPSSRANGPGLRAALWVQGCSLGCPGCFNPETHPFNGGQMVAVSELAQRIVGLKDTIEGLTISGGEPLQQRPALLALLRRVRQETSLSILLFTGFSWPEVQRMPEAQALLACVDLLLAGRYDPAQRLARGLLGSANKTIHFLTDRYSMSDLQAVPHAEVVITASGELLLSGIDPVVWP
jgi:anaerobic ribonucleoside-triphosphate reductase activating protein